jgi:hypothetical protein
MWSPKREKDGDRSPFYDFMRTTRPGDAVVSFADTQIRYIGYVCGFPLSAPKPSEFGSAGSYWSNDGWYVPVNWLPVPAPVRPKDMIEQIAPLLPGKYSPIQKNGNGNQKAYLAEIGDALFNLIARTAGLSEGFPPVDFDLTDSLAVRAGEEKAIEQAVSSDTSLDSTQRLALVLARKGQGVFRQNVEQIERSCRLTGLRDRRLLTASHIKPWRVCSSPSERLDGHNGLLLSAHADKLFDIGLISFEKSGRVLVSETLDADAIDCLGLRAAILAGAGAFSDEQEVYLKYHRQELFLA